MHQNINSFLLFIVFFITVSMPLIRRLEFSIDRTFWEKKPYGFHITLWVYPVKSTSSNSGRSIFTFRWRNPDKIPDDIKKCK